MAQLLRKMSAKEGATMARKPWSSSAQGACSREEPQPKLAPASSTGAPAKAGSLSTNSGSLRQSSKRNSPKPLRSMRLRYLAGMI